LFWVGFFVGAVVGAAAMISAVVWFTDEKDR
jgi:hypothetical protein